MQRGAFLLLNLIGLTLIPGTVRADRDLQCEKFLAQVRDVSKKLPIMVDEVTKVVELSVNCETRIVKYVRHLIVTEDRLAKGFAERKQRQHRNLNCNKEGVAKAGWTAVDYVYDSNFKLLTKLTTTPQDCDGM